MVRTWGALLAALALSLQPPAAVLAQTIAEALDQPGLAFTASGDAAWFGQTAETWDGIDALESGPVGDGQASSVQVECTYLNGGRVRFWWRVSSEQDRDAVVFLIDGAEVSRASGQSGWDQPVFTVGPGPHRFRWEYRKDGSGADGLDRAWIDAFEVIDLAPFSEVWAVSYDGYSHLDDAGADVDVGPDGRLYVAGTLNKEGPQGWLGKFSAEGTMLWSKYFPGKAEGVAVARDGSIYVTGTASGRMYVMKFASSGCYYWKKTFEGRGLAIAVSSSGGAIYVTGAAAGDVAVRKLSPGGCLIWSRTFDGPAGLGDEGRAIVVDRAGNVYAAGFVRRSGQGKNIWLRKFTAAGAVLWTREVSRVGSGDDWANGIALDPLDNVYVTGTTSWAGKPIFWAGAYSPGGRKLWGRELQFPQYSDVRGNDLALAANGSLNIVGTGSTPAGSKQPFVLRLRADSGAVLDEYDLALLAPGTAEGVVKLGDGCVFTGGVRYPPAEGGNDILLARYR